MFPKQTTVATMAAPKHVAWRPRTAVQILLMALGVGSILVGWVVPALAGNDLTTDNLRGKVKTITAESGVLAPESGRWLSRLGPAEGKEYDLNGYLLRTYSLGGDNVIDEATIVIYEYQMSDGLVKRLVMHRGAQSSTAVIYKYDAKRRLTRIESKASGSQREVNYITNVNPDAATSETQLKSPSGLSMGRTVATIDADGKPLLLQYFNSRGDLVSQEATVSDPITGEKVLTIRRNTLGEKKPRFTQAREEHRFNVAGLEIERAAYSSEGELSYKLAFAYEFDAQGNWIKQISSRWTVLDGGTSFVPESAVRRVITYYD